MSKRARQYIGLLAAVAAYYVIHEGAHLLYALCTGVFRQINIMGMGVQIDVFAERMTDVQLGWFCLVGPMAAVAAGYVLTALAGRIGRAQSKLFRACMYYATLALLVLDPAYLSLFYSLVGGGDMNGIALLVPETAARIVSGVMLAGNILLIVKRVLPVYTQSFRENG